MKSIESHLGLFVRVWNRWRMKYAYLITPAYGTLTVSRTLLCVQRQANLSLGQAHCKSPELEIACKFTDIAQLLIFDSIVTRIRQHLEPERFYWHGARSRLYLVDGVCQHSARCTRFVWREDINRLKAVFQWCFYENKYQRYICYCGLKSKYTRCISSFQNTNQTTFWGCWDSFQFNIDLLI